MAEGDSSAMPGGSGIKRVHFSPEIDLTLLDMVNSENPFEDFKIWEQISVILKEAYSQPFTARTVKDRVMRLLKQYKSEESKSLKKSGVDEDYDHRQFVLEQIKELEREALVSKEKKKKKSTSEEDKTKAKGIRDAALETLTKKRSDEKSVTPTNENDSSDEAANSSQPPPKKKKRNVDEMAIDYLKEKSERETDIRKKELEVRKEELEVQKEQISLNREQSQRFLVYLKEKYGPTLRDRPQLPYPEFIP